MNNPIEGYFLVTNEDLIFEVKGIVHPHDRYIAYLRYVLDQDGERKSSEGKYFKKIYPLEDRELYLQENYPYYLQFDERYNRVLQVVQKEQVAYSLNPVDGLNRIRNSGVHTSPLQRATLALSEILVTSSGIPQESLGVTGSLLVNITTRESDIDLIVYGEQAGFQLYNTLRNKYDSIERIQRYTDERLQKHVEFRWGVGNLYNQILGKIEQEKVLQGIFNGFDFFIRLVKYPSEVSYGYLDRVYQSIGTRVLNCRILDDSQSIFTPCEYQVSCEDVSSLRYIMSYRGRYTEHVRKGMNVEVMGRMEKVFQNDGSHWTQMVLGENNTDYLVPI